MAVAAYILYGISLVRVGVHPADRPVEITGDRQVVIDRCGRIVVAQVIHPVRDALAIDKAVTGFALHGAMRTVVVERSGLSWDAPSPYSDVTLGEDLLRPTRIYVKGAVAAIAEGRVLHGLAHITGGGLTENLPRMMPEGLGAEVDLSAWELPPVFQWLAQEGGIERPELLKTFNCGIGMVAAVPEDKVDVATWAFAQDGHDVKVIGRVVDGEGVTYRGDLA